MTVEEIIDIAKVSQYLSTGAVIKGGLYGGGNDIQLPRKLYCIRDDVEWMYDNEPSNTTLFETSRYLYALCGIYKFKAASVLGTGGSIAPVIPEYNNCGGAVIITAADFSADGKTVERTDWLNKTLTIFWNNINRFILQADGEWAYNPTGGFEILVPSDFDANYINADAIFIVFVSCEPPGPAYVPPSSGGGSDLERATFSGDGVTVTFQIPHLLSGTPSYVIQPVGEDSAGEYSSNADSTNITITYNVAPPVGSDNVIFDWAANL